MNSQNKAAIISYALLTAASCLTILVYLVLRDEMMKVYTELLEGEPIPNVTNWVYDYGMYVLSAFAILSMISLVISFRKIEHMFNSWYYFSVLAVGEILCVLWVMLGFLLPILSLGHKSGG